MRTLKIFSFENQLSYSYSNVNAVYLNDIITQRTMRIQLFFSLRNIWNYIAKLANIILASLLLNGICEMIEMWKHQYIRSFSFDGIETFTKLFISVYVNILRNKKRAPFLFSAVEKSLGCSNCCSQKN